MQLSAIIRKEGRLYASWCPELDVASQGSTVEEALSNLKEAAGLLLEDEAAPRRRQTVHITTFEVHGAPDPRRARA